MNELNITSPIQKGLDNAVVIDPITKEVMGEALIHVAGQYKFAVTFYHPIKRWTPPTFCEDLAKAEKTLKQYQKLALGFMCKSEKWTKEQLEKATLTLKICDVVEVSAI